MFKKKKNLNLPKFPYKYECRNCHHPETKMIHSKEADILLKGNFGINSSLPLFFECVFCKTGLIKPKGYHGHPSLIVECEKDNDL